MKEPSSSETINLAEDIFLSEKVVLLNVSNEPIGSAPKLEIHHSNTPLHLAFSVYIFNNKNKFLITKRASVKKVWPNVWTNSCCGHPMPEETMENAIRRRAKFELGLELSIITNIIPDYKYKTPPYKGIIEHEFCPVYAARAITEVVKNNREVDDFKWVEWPEYIKSAEQDTNNEWSWWCKDQLRLITQTNALNEYLAS